MKFFKNTMNSIGTFKKAKHSIIGSPMLLLFLALFLILDTIFFVLYYFIVGLCLVIFTVLIVLSFAYYTIKLDYKESSLLVIKGYKSFFKQLKEYK